MRAWLKLVVALVVAVGVVVVARDRWSRSGSDPAQASLAPAVPPTSLAACTSSVEQFTYTRRITDVQPLGDRVWVSTTGGLVELDRRTRRFVKLYTGVDGLPGLVCSDLLAIGHSLWIAGDGGLVRWDPGSDRFDLTDPHSVGALHYQPERQVLWASGRETMVRIDLATGKAQSWPTKPSRAMRIVDDEVWTAARREGSSHVSVTCLRPLQDATPLALGEDVLPQASDVWLCPAGDSMWAMSRDPELREGLGRIDRASGQARLYQAADGLPGDYPYCVQAHGDDLWVACAAEGWAMLERKGPIRYFDRTLARFNAATGRWETHAALSGARRDEPTTIKEVDGDLWVATRGYDETRKMVVGWMMVPYEHEAPVVTHLALCRWQPESGTWEAHRFPAEHNYSQITDFWLTGTDFWLLIDRTNVEKPSFSGPDPAGGFWLASCPRSGGELQWHFRLRGRDWSDEWPRSRAGRPPLPDVWLIDDTPWACREEDVRYFDADRREWQEVAWPSPLPKTQVQQVAAAGGEVWLGTGEGSLLRLEPAQAAFGVQGQMTMSGSEYTAAPLPASVVAAAPRPRVGPWGPPVPASILTLSFGADGRLWATAAGRAYHYNPQARESPTGPPSWFAPAGLLCRSEAEWLVPTAMPWSSRHRGATDECRFQAPPDPNSPGVSYSTAAIPSRLTGWGELGAACVLAEGDRLWLGTLSDGLYLLENSRWQRLGPLPPQELPPDLEKPMPLRPDDLILALARVDDRLYVSAGEHLYRLLLPERKWEEVGPSLCEQMRRAIVRGQMPGAEVSPYYVRRIFSVELKGDLWLTLALQEGSPELHRLRAGDAEPEHVPLPAAPLCAMAHEGYLWVGTEDGLVRIDPKTGGEQVLTDWCGLPEWEVSALAAEGESLWAASSAVVTRLTTDGFNEQAQVVVR